MLRTTTTDGYRNFLISGMGRSGTKFLSNVMNLSRVWTVEHEVTRADHELPLETVQERLDRDYYGEVNSCLRFHLHRVKVGRLGVIIRDPSDILLSMMNRGKHSRASCLDQLALALGIIDASVQRGAQPILFEYMTGYHDYLSKVLRDFAIHDVDVASVDLSRKVNTNKKQDFTEFSDLPGTLRYEFLTACGWYIDKYGYDRPE